MASEAMATATDAIHTSMSNLTVSATGNLTSSFSTHMKDVVLFPFRVMTRFDRFLFTTLPRFLIYTTGLNTLANRALGLFQTGEAAGMAGVAEVAQAADAVTNTWTELIMDAFQASTNKSYWGMLHYMASRWAFTCLMLAGVLNRVTVYGSSRQRITLTWPLRLAMRLIPIILFVSQIHQLLQAVRCQTSPDFSLYRHGDNNLYSVYDWSIEGGTLHTMSSNALFWSTDEEACSALGMQQSENGRRAKYGSFSLLWPTFLRLGLSHLVENLSCSLQQIPTMTEVGLSVFEHSLAFAEAESMITHTLNRQAAKSAAAAVNTTTVTVTTTAAVTEPSQTFLAASGTITAITDAMQALTGPHIFDSINVPIQVLLVALISCGNSLTVHIMAVLGKKNKWRLVNTGFWGLAYMAAFAWGFVADTDMVRIDQHGSKPMSGLVHFPTVAIVGLMPHIIIILGIVVCIAIYLIALMLTAVSLGTNPNIRQPTSLKERVCIAHDNLQAAIQLKSVQIRWYEDFYTALLRVGFAALTAAAEAVFLNEGRAVEMRQFTWLEEDRLDELDAGRTMGQSSAHFQIVEKYGIPQSTFGDDDNQPGPWRSGYEKERKLEKDSTSRNKDQFIYPNPRTDGIGALQRTTRFYLLLIFIRGIIFTIGGWVAFGIGAFLDRIGITARPAWLRRVVGNSLKRAADDGNRLRSMDDNKRFNEWVEQQGNPASSNKDDIDIEVEMRKKILSEGHADPEKVLEEQMYQWWKGGGWYSNKDDSGDFALPSIEIDEDATSVITTATTTSHTSNDDAWESEPEGARTPTQRHLTPTWSFAGLRNRFTPTPEPEQPILDNTTLARLLNPLDKQTRDEARILSSHLASTSGIMTRSRFRQQFETENAKVLLAGRMPPQQLNTPQPQSSSRRPLTADEEAHVLEELLITRREQKTRKGGSTSATASDTNADNTTMSGPPCVVCQSEPRTIIAWPCRCLTVCEDCRVNLAMNNFGNCVTCRRNVGGFVRLYVP